MSKKTFTFFLLSFFFVSFVWVSFSAPVAYSFHTPESRPFYEGDCINDEDDDGDTFIDGNDLYCRTGPHDRESPAPIPIIDDPPPTLPACSNTSDDDEDGRADYLNNDRGCDDANDDSEEDLPLQEVPVEGDNNTARGLSTYKISFRPGIRLNSSTPINIHFPAGFFINCSPFGSSDQTYSGNVEWTDHGACPSPREDHIYITLTPNQTIRHDQEIWYRATKIINPSSEGTYPIRIIRFDNDEANPEITIGPFVPPQRGCDLFDTNCWLTALPAAFIDFIIKTFISPLLTAIVDLSKGFALSLLNVAIRVNWHF